MAQGITWIIRKVIHASGVLPVSGGNYKIIIKKIETNKGLEFPPPTVHRNAPHPHQKPRTNHT